MSRLRIFTLLLVVMLVLPVVQSQDEPVIYIFNNSGTLQFDAGGSDPDVLQRVQDHIAEQSGVRPITIVPGGAASSTEQLNLLLGLSDPVDLFQAPGTAGTITKWRLDPLPTCWTRMARIF